MSDEEMESKLHSVRDVSRITGVSIRTLHYYDEIGLLPPTTVTESGYRLYDAEALRRLQCILLYRELEFPLREIRDLMCVSGFDMEKALERQIALLRKKRTHIDNLITLAEGIKILGVNQLDFSGFDARKIDEYEEQAQAAWGETKEFREYREKAAGRTAEENRVLAAGVMGIFAGFGRLRGLDPSDDRVQEKVKELRDYITENYYTCSDGILLALGRMYSNGEKIQRNIDKTGGEGTAALVSRAIAYYCGSEE